MIDWLIFLTMRKMNVSLYLNDLNLISIVHNRSLKLIKRNTASSIQHAVYGGELLPSPWRDFF